MIFLLSPAKSLDYTASAPEVPHTTPQWMAQAAQLVELLKPLASTQLAALMDISPALAELNVQRFQDWRPRMTARNSRPAVFAFDGDVYDGLQARHMAVEDLLWAQQHVCILSGLYGVLRPLDRMQAYRLEMGTTLTNAHGKDLYAFWGDTIAQYLNQRLRNDASPVVVNLASEEYAKAVHKRALKAPLVQCVFEELRDGRYKIISFMAKRARGLMLRFAIEQRLTLPSQLQAFCADGYAYAGDVSTPDRLVFRRG